MIISMCIPCGNRLSDIKNTMPFTLLAANYSPPVEIVVLDYGSTDGLRLWFDRMMFGASLNDGNSLRYVRYSGKGYFHKAHAFNLSILASTGEYFVLMGADAYPAREYISEVRKLIEQGYDWMHAKDVCGIIACNKQVFIDAGGYDERFEFYGPEDRDLEDRLVRRDCKLGIVPKGLMRVIQTPDNLKVSNFRLSLSKREMSRRMHKIYDENVSKGVLVANQGMEWGKWQT